MQGEVMPGKGWSEKDERKYEAIKESERERGASEERAQEIAARTVNRDRREEGRTPNTRTQGTTPTHRMKSGRATCGRIWPANATLMVTAS